MTPHIFLAALIGGMMSSTAAEPHRAIDMVVEEIDGIVEVSLRGQSRIDQKVSYRLELIGSSTSRHKGATSLRADEAAILSTMRMNATDGWCVKAQIEEEDGRAYEYSEGACS
jgi:hypothetical protein